MTEAKDTGSTPLAWREVEPAIYDLTGAASVAALVLDALRKTGGDPFPISYLEGLGWLEGRLSAAAENMLAIHEKRPPNWQTMNEADAIQAALTLATKHGEERCAKRTARDDERAAA